MPDQHGLTFQLRARRARHHQIIAVDHRTSRLIPKHRFNLGRLLTGNPYRVGRIVGNQTTRDLTSVRIQNGDCIAA
jgi:hypothetical protein